MRGVSYTSHADSFYVGSFSYTSRAAFLSFLCGEFLLHIPRWLQFYASSFYHTYHADCFYRVSFSCTSTAVLICIEEVSITHPMLASFLSGEFLLHIPCWLNFYMGSFSYTSHAGFIFLWGVLFTHPMLALFFVGSFSYTSHTGFFF